MKGKLRLFHFFTRSFLLQTLWNFEQMQNIGFAYCMSSMLKSMYPDPEKRYAALRRHLGFFNTHPYMACIILGLTMSMERDYAAGRAVRLEEIIAVKKNMAGPLAAIGDNFFWGTWRPFVATLTIGLVVVMFENGTPDMLWLIPLFFVCCYNVLTIGFRFWSLKISFLYRDQIIQAFASLKIQGIREILARIGCVLVLAVTVLYVLKFGSGMVDTVILSTFFTVALLLAGISFPADLLFYLVLVICLEVAFL